MEIGEFSELSSFISAEYEKLMDTFSLEKMPEKSIVFVEKSIRKYSKLYDKPLYRKEKRNLKLQIAIDTMPHGFWWKVFHAKTWKQIQEMLNQKPSEEEKVSIEQPTNAITLVPAIIEQHVSDEFEICQKTTLEDDF